MNHPKQTISFLEQDAPSQKDPIFCQRDITTYLAWKVKEELAWIVQNVDVSHCSAEHVLLLVREAVHRFRRLAGDEEELLEVEYEMLDKRVRIAQRSKEEQQEAMPPCGTGWLFHQQALEMERNELICKIKRSSRSNSPETPSTPSHEGPDGSKAAMEQAGGLIFSLETANLLEDSTITSHVSDYISSKSFAKNRHPKGKERIEFPGLHKALLFGTDQEARSWARRLESNNEDVELVDFFKRKVAHVAAEVGRVQLLNARQARCFRSNSANDHCPSWSPVMLQASDQCRLLISAGFNQDVRDSSGRNLLSIACRRRHLRIVEYLINELSFLPNDDHGRYFCSPLHDAIESGDLPICAFLINSGANVYQQFNNKTPRDLAREKGKSSIFQLINDEMTRTSSQYKPRHDVDHLSSQQCLPVSQSYDAASHSSNAHLRLLTAANPQYMDPRPLRDTWDGQLRP